MCGYTSKTETGTMHKLTKFIKFSYTVKNTLIKSEEEKNKKKFIFFLTGFFFYLSYYFTTFFNK